VVQLVVYIEVNTVLQSTISVKLVFHPRNTGSNSVGVIFFDIRLSNMAFESCVFLEIAVIGQNRAPLWS